MLHDKAQTFFFLFEASYDRVIGSGAPCPCSSMAPASLLPKQGLHSHFPFPFKDKKRKGSCYHCGESLCG